MQFIIELHYRLSFLYTYLIMMNNKVIIKVKVNKFNTIILKSKLTAPPLLLKVTITAAVTVTLVMTKLN